MTKSSELTDVLFNGQASRPYNNTGTHLLVKTKEIALHRPNRKNIVYPAAMDTIKQLTVAKIFGVFVHCGFKCDNHVDFILSVCSQRVFLLNLIGVCSST